MLGENERVSDTEFAPVDNYSEQFHIFSVEWDPYTIKWMVDGVIIRTEHKYVLNLNQGTNGNGAPLECGSEVPNTTLGGAYYRRNEIFPDKEPDGHRWFHVYFTHSLYSDLLNVTTTQFPVDFEIDYVRVYQKLESENAPKNLCYHEIQGDREICSGERTHTYTLNRNEEMTDVIWTSSDNIIVESQTVNTVTIKAIAEGIGWIRAQLPEISDYCDESSFYFQIDVKSHPIFLSTNLVVDELEDCLLNEGTINNCGTHINGTEIDVIACVDSELCLNYIVYKGQTVVSDNSNFQLTDLEQGDLQAGTFCWTPKITDINSSPHTITLLTEDLEGCNEISTLTYNIDVIPPPTLIPDEITLCVESQTHIPYTFNNYEDFTDYRFNMISSSTGEDYLQPSNNVFIAAAEGTFVYEVYAVHRASGCMVMQEITIEVGKTFDLDIEASVHICRGGSTVLGTNITGSVPIGYYEYKVLIDNQEVDAYDYLNNPNDPTPTFTMPYEGGNFKVKLTITSETCVSNVINIDISDDTVYLEDVSRCEGSQINLGEYLTICPPQPALTLAHWNFSGLNNSSGSVLTNSDLVPVTANSNNTSQIVQLRHTDDYPEIDEEKSIYFDNTKNALYASHWDKAQGDLANMEKFWYLTVNSTDFKDLQVFVQQSGEARAPRDFDLEYSLDFERWEKVADGQPMTDTDPSVFKTTFEEVFLPTACDDQAILYIRFLRENKDPAQAINGSSIKAEYKSYIRDIHITGRAIEPTVPNYTYNWQVNTLPIDDTQSPNPIVTASQIGTYAASVTIYDETGNQYGTASGTIEVTASPNQMTANPQQTQICPGETLSIDLSGADNYTWEANTTNGINVTPNDSFNSSAATLQQAVSLSATGEITYTINGFYDNSDCVLTKIVTITVGGTNNTFSSVPNLSNVCVDETLLIPLSGADSYTWELETSTNSGVYPNSYDYSGTVNASTGTIEEDFGDIVGNGGTITYRITGYFANDCPVVNTIVVNALPTPTLSLSPSFQKVCPNENFSIIIEDFEANVNYNWTVNLPNGVTGLSGGIANSENITLSVTNTSGSNQILTYTVNASENNACSVSETVTVEVIHDASNGTRCDAEEGLIVNEVGVGGSFETPFVELLVKSNSNCDPVDIRNFVIDDNNGDFSNAFNGSNVRQGHIRFKDIPRWASVEPYALIVIYDNIAHTNSNTPIPADDPDDTNPHDGVYVLPISDNGLIKQPFAPNFVMVNGNPSENPNYTPASYFETQSSDWSHIALAHIGDAMQVRNPDGTYFHGISYGGNPIMGGPDGLLIENLNGFGQVYSFEPTPLFTGGDFNGDEYRELAHFEVGNGLGTPGLFNSIGNEDFAVQMTTTGGCFNGQHGKALDKGSDELVSWNIYPNPSNSSFTIELQLSADLTTDLRIFDITGKEVLKIYEHNTLTKGLYPIKVNDEQLPAGVYICQLKYEDKTGQEYRDYLKLVKTQ